MKKLLALGVCALATWAAVNAQTTKQFKGDYANGTATYSYYVDPETQNYVKHGSFNYKTGSGFTITGSFTHGKRNGNWVFKTTASNVKTTRYIGSEPLYVTVNGSEVITVNYKDGLYHGAFSIIKNFKTTAKNRWGGNEPLFSKNVNLTVKVNFNNGKLVGSAYVKEDDLEIKGQYTDDSYCSGTWTIRKPSEDIYETHVYKNTYLISRSFRDEDGQLLDKSKNYINTYNDFEPFISQSAEVQLQNDFEVNKLCDENSGYTTYRIIQKILNFYEDGNLTNKLEGDLSNQSNSDWGGCVNFISDYRSSYSYVPYLNTVHEREDIFEVLKDLNEIDMDKVKPSERNRIKVLKDSIEALFESAKSNYKTISAQLDTSLQHAANVYNSFNGGNSLSNDKIYPADKIFKTGNKEVYYVTTEEFKLPNRDYYSTRLNAATPAYALLANSIYTSQSVKAELAKKSNRFYVRSGYEYFDYYPFTPTSSKNPAYQNNLVSKLCLTTLQKEEMVYDSLTLLIKSTKKSSVTKSKVLSAYNVFGEVAKSVYGCSRCGIPFYLSDSLKIKTATYLKSLEKLESLLAKTKELQNMELELITTNLKSKEALSAEKNALYKSGHALSLNLTSSIMSINETEDTLNTSLVSFENALNTLTQKWIDAINSVNTTNTAIDNIKEERARLDSVKASTLALAEAAGVKEYVSCYSLFDKTLAAKFKELDSTPSSATTSSAYQAEIATATTNLTSEMEPFVLLQSVLSKPLTKENKKAIKGASKDPVALMAVLKTL